MNDLKSRLTFFSGGNFIQLLFIICGTAKTLLTFVCNWDERQNHDLCFCFKNTVKISLNADNFNLLVQNYRLLLLTSCVHVRGGSEILES